MHEWQRPGRGRAHLAGRTIRAHRPAAAAATGEAEESFNFVPAPAADTAPTPGRAESPEPSLPGAASEVVD